MTDKNVLVVPTRGLSSSGGYSRRESNFLNHAELVFDDMTFVVGKGKDEKVILNNVGAKITNGRKLNFYQKSYIICYRYRYWLLTLLNLNVTLQTSWPSWDPQVRLTSFKNINNGDGSVHRPLNHILLLFISCANTPFFFPCQVLERRLLFRP